MPAKKIFPALLVFILLSTAVSAQQDRKLVIKGLRLRTEERLFTELHLERFEEGKISLPDVVSLIEKFYLDNNYTLVKVYIIDLKAKNKSVLFVDEGRIGKVIIHGLNNYYSLKFKQNIHIPERIYNSKTIEQNLDILRNKFRGYIITADLLKPPDYEGNIIQLDREIQKLNLGEIINLEFFNRFIPHHDLHFYAVSDRSNSEFGEKINGFGFNINVRPPSLFIPQISYYDENIFFAKDYVEGELSAGINPGFSGFVKYPPKNTLELPPKVAFIELTGEYKVSPLQNRFIGPLFRARVYHSDTTRDDIGLESYRYLNSRLTVAPEFTLLKNLNIYAGFGREEIMVYRSDIDYTAPEHIDSPDGTYYSSFAEMRIKFDPIPIRIGNRINKYITITYTDYFSGNSANRLTIQGAYDAEFENLSIFSLRSGAVLLYDNPPFYMSENVNNTVFKGFSGKGYYAKKKAAASTEYRFSLYQDYLYGGLFFDWTRFQPDGYKLSGTKHGINYGPTARVLIYDQFEFIIYLGFDRLFPDGDRAKNLQMKLTKKW